MVRYNQVKGIKKSGSTDQSNHRFPTFTTAYSHCIFIISSIQAMSSRENPKTKMIKPYMILIDYLKVLK